MVAQSLLLSGGQGWSVGAVPRTTPQPLTAWPSLPADINECVTDLHTCSRREHCVNTVGSFHCYKALTCEPGYRLQDGECTGEEGWLQAPPLALLRPAHPSALLSPAPYPAPPRPLGRPELAPSGKFQAPGFLAS